jgi:LytS/YehU family sensor histidine kinase
MASRSSYLVRMAATNLAAAIFVAVAFFGAGTRLPAGESLESLAVALLFSICIGIPCSILLPRVARRLWHVGFPWNWTGLVGVMFALAMAGSAVAIGVLVAVGYIPSRAFDEWFGGSVQYAVITTLTFGITISLYEKMRAQLDAATLALRTKERDEAEARRLAVTAQLTSLESRVQPHFLFNTLNSIASLIPSDPDAAEKMTGQLASLLRSSLEAGEQPLVPLDQEMEMVRNYLDIEQVRFGERLRRELTVDHEAAAALVPRFSLQTLAENAVKYAIAPRRQGGRISVHARAQNGRVRIEVADDGPGFDPASIPPNHGLSALRQRLAITLGERASLDVRSSASGTRVVIEVPH